MKTFMKFIILCLLLGFFLTVGCARSLEQDKRKRLSIYQLRDAEESLGTDGEKNWIYHRVVEEPNSLCLNFPGYLIGVEKAKAERITTKDEPHIKEFMKKLQNKYCKRDDGSIKCDGFAGEIENGVTSDKKRHFISHIFSYDVSANNPKRIYTNQLYNVYEEIDLSDETKCHFWKCCDAIDYSKNNSKMPINCSFSRSFDALNVLKKNLTDKIANCRKRVTHIFFYSMGWHTDQQEAIRNFNSLFGNLLDVARENEGKAKGFNPLFVCITWPSTWDSQFIWPFDAIQKGLSYFNKADDADEVGSMWGNYLLYDVILSQKQKDRDIKVIVFGHSFGARLTSTAVFTRDLLPIDYRNTTYHPDLYIGLQGAFSVNRFLKGEGNEGSPYTNGLNDKVKLVYTWSKYDKANPVAKVITTADHIGGNYGYIKAKKYITAHNAASHPNPSLHFATIEVEEKTDKINLKIYQEDVPNSTSWGEADIIIVNASDIINEATYRKGGEAHSDIYNKEVAHFVWKLMREFAWK